MQNLASLVRPATMCEHMVRCAGTVLVTREQGKNNALIDSLSAIGISTLELPLIVSVPGPDVSKLPEVLRERSFDYVALTSPEAADVFLQGWREAGQPEVRIATVGKGVLQWHGVYAFDTPAPCPPEGFASSCVGT